MKLAADFPAFELDDAPISRSQWLRRILLWRPHGTTALQAASLIVVLVVLLPVAYLLLRALSGGEEALDYLLRERTLTVIGNSVVLMLAVVASAALIGVPFAWLTTRTDLPLRRVWLVLGLLTMVIPSYLASVTYLEALGSHGMVQSLLAPLTGGAALPDMRGFFGAWLVITLMAYPYVVLPVRAALLNSDPAFEEVGRSLGLGRWQIFWRVTLPQLRPALASGMLLAALYTLSDFGAVAVMRYNAFTRAIFLQTSAFRLDRAAALALVLVLMMLILLVLERRIASSVRNYRAGTGVKRQLKTVKLGKWRIPALIFSAGLVLLGSGVPIFVLLNWLITRERISHPVGVNMGELISNTVSLSMAAAVVVALAALPLALLAVRSRSRIDRTMVAFAYTGNALPGIVIALALVYFASNYASGIYQTVPLLVLGYAICYLPLGISATRSTLTQINPRLEEAGRSLGLSSFGVLRRIIVPLSWSGIVAGAALVFLSVMKELPITLILQPIGLRTFATRIWSLYEEAFLAYIGLPGLILILTSAMALGIILWRNHHQRN